MDKQQHETRHIKDVTGKQKVKSDTSLALNVPTGLDVVVAS